MNKLFGITLLSLLFSTIGYAQQTIYVSPGAAKGGKGTLQSPYASLEEAQKAVRRINKKMTGDITVYLREGTYYMASPLRFSEKDSGTNGHRVIYKAYQGETPVISGGQKVTGWEPTMHRNIYSAPFKSESKLRALFVNGQRARMAITSQPISGQGSWGALKVNGNEHWAYGEGTVVEGIKFLNEDLPLLSNPEDVELIHKHVWNEKILCASEVARLDNDTLVVKLQQPYGAILTSLAWAGSTQYDKGFFIRNAFELLDSPGEFYYDRKKQRIYYYTEDEDMSKAEVIAPVSEGLIRIYGTSNTSKVENLAFEGITFSHDAWELMEIDGSYGFGGIQSLGLAIKYIPNGNWHPTKYNSTDVPPGTIDVKNSKNISFVGNRFEQLNSATSISYVNDVTDSQIIGNFFNDLLGNAVNVGHPQHYEIGDGDIYGPGIEGVCKNIKITNNYIRNISLDFRMVEAILAFFVENVNFDYNDIAGTPYGAIANGWWWANAGIPPSTVAKNNTMNYNRIHNTHLVLHDGGMLYTLGKQPDSQIIGNYLTDGPRCIYPDDGSAYFTIKDNVIYSLHNLWLHIASDRCHDIVIDHNFVKDNGTINNGVNTPLTNTINFRNRPFDDESKALMEKAGIQAPYKNIIPKEEPKEISIYPFVQKEAWIN
ncbi:right-handed parallel beta-helix repeat-containing protein [Bacteroides sp. 224]|uniref:right-handed parallel beta-helix repeat-containing protein n=1 Tax=Bacteroides sp. 224 TaxID=2302936 RepID=UPI0013D49293|nr:right-handed parallel beta-helix repeat-containing protein [Bacteroides sp. 224]NDV64039.1 hypothetical protein [Bacteroides sp. 224]